MTSRQIVNRILLGLCMLLITSNSNACPLRFNQAEWRDPQTQVDWLVCPLGQTLKKNECQGPVKTLDWLSAQQQISSKWRLPSLPELVSALTQCSPISLTPYVFWSRTTPVEHPLLAFATRADGIVMTEYKTESLALLLVRVPNNQEGIKSNDDDETWVNGYRQLHKALNADAATALKIANQFEIENRWAFAIQIYQHLLQRKGNTALSKINRDRVLRMQTTAQERYDLIAPELRQ